LGEGNRLAVVVQRGETIMASTPIARLIRLIACLAIMTLSITPVFAQDMPNSPIAQPHAPSGTPTDHEQIHRVIDEMFGPGTS
jgi:hypothetical protein